MCTIANLQDEARTLMQLMKKYMIKLYITSIGNREPNKNV